MVRVASILLLSLLWPVASATADAPSVSRLFPSGAARGATVEVKAGGKLGTAPVRVWADDPGISVTVPEKGDTLQIAVADHVRPGVHWLRFFNAEGATSPRPFIVSSVAEVNEKEPNDSVGESNAVDALPAVVNGVLSKSNEVDTYRVSLQQGQTLVAAVDAHTTLGSPMDAVLQIVSPANFVLDQNDDERGFDPQLTFAAPANGEYHVRVFAFPAAPNSSIRFSGGADYVYRLTLTTGPYADHPVPFAVRRGESAELALAGWNLGSEPFAIPVSSQSELGVAPLADLRLANSTAVRVVDADVAVEAEPNDAEPRQTFSGPVVISGHLDRTDDVDRFQLRAAKDQKLLLRVAARSIGSPVDPVLTVSDASGKVLKRVDDESRSNYDSEYDFTAPAEGDYTIEVRDLHGRGGVRFAYLLSLVERKPDFELKIGKTEFVVPKDKPLSIPVSIDRQFGFSGPIDILPVGLPPGVTAEAVQSERKGKSAKDVSLTLKRDPGATEGFNGPIRIVGRVMPESVEADETKAGEAEEAGDSKPDQEPEASAAKPDSAVPPPPKPGFSPKLERTARATISGFDTTIAEIWLTVPPAK